MPKLFDYECNTCGHIFEDWDTAPQCKHCGSKNLHKVFVTPFGTESRSTKFMDSAIKEMTRAHGMTDYQNNPSRTHAKQNPMQIKGFNKEKDMGEQVAGEIANMRGGITPGHIQSVPFNRGKPIENIPVFDQETGNSFQQIQRDHRKSRYRERATTSIAGIDRDKREWVRGR